MIIIQHQQRPSLPAQPYVPFQGIAWLTQWEPPQFPRKVPVQLMETEFNTLINFPPPPVGISGISWMLGWEPPYFPTKVPVQLMPTQFYAFNPVELSAGIQGIAWRNAWEPPFFPTTTKVYLQQTEFVALIPDTLPPPIDGMAWYTPFDQPKQVKTNRNAHQFITGTLNANSLPVGISGHAWNRPWEPPYFKKEAKYYLHKFEVRVPINFSVKISGIAWYRPFDQPKQRKTPPELHKFNTGYMHFQGRGTVHAYIIGGAR